MTDLHEDLLIDLTQRAHTPPVSALPPVPPDLVATTPVLTASLTPLQWSRVRVVRAEVGVGRGLLLGPLRLEVSVRAGSPAPHGAARRR